MPIRTNADLRPSRLVKSIPSYVRRSLVTILRIFVLYRPMAFFFWPGLFLTTIGGIATLRFLYFYFATGNGNGHVQSLILGTLCIILGALMFMIALLADMITANRKLLERITLRVQRIEHQRSRV